MHMIQTTLEDVQKYRGKIVVIEINIPFNQGCTNWTSNWLEVQFKFDFFELQTVLILSFTLHYLDNVITRKLNFLF